MARTNVARNKEGARKHGDVTLGQVFYTLRVRRGMSLSELSKAMGGPSESRLWRMEAGEGTPSPNILSRLSRFFGLDEAKALNAAGWASPTQQYEGFQYLAEQAGEPEPQRVTLPVLDPEAPDLPPVERATHMLRRREDGFVVRLSAPQNQPFVGEIIAVNRPPRSGQGVVVKIGGRLTAWTFCGDHIENGDGKTMESGYEVMGSIIRVVSVTSYDFEEE